MAAALLARTPTARASVVLAAGALALSGCAGPQDADAPATSQTSAAAGTSAPPATASTPAPAAAVAAALAAGREAASGHVEATTETRAGERTTTSTTTGVFSDTALRMEITTDIPGRGQSTLQIRQVDGSAYLYGLPGLAPDQWVQAPLDQLGAAAGTAGGTDPSQRLDLLEQAGDVERVGQEVVGDVRTTHHTGTIDLQAAAQGAQQQSSGGAGVEQPPQQADLSPAAFDLYVGPDELPVRIVTTVETTAGDQTSTTTSTVDLSDWGAEVDVQVPDGAVPITEVAPAAPTASPTP